VLFTIAKFWNNPRGPSMDEWIKKMWYIYTVEFYSDKKNKVMLIAGKWMELEIIMLCEISQSHKDNCHMFSLICGS
jgi:hypothetical protein